VKHIIKKILKEENNTKVINLILNNLKSGRIKPPYIRNLVDLGLEDEEVKYILEMYLEGKFENDQGINLFINDNGDVVYEEDFSDDFWSISKYDERGNHIYSEDSEGEWIKKEFDENGLIYKETSDEGVTIDRR
jgi:hypothetical protein